jgi:hypothetical protein
MTHPLRENLEINIDASGAFVRCSRCQRPLCPSTEDWKTACVRKLDSPTKAGPLMGDLVGHFVLEQLYCPSCGALFHTDFVDVKSKSQEL